VVVVLLLLLLLLRGGCVRPSASALGRQLYLAQSIRPSCQCRVVVARITRSAGPVNSRDDVLHQSAVVRSDADDDDDDDDDGDGLQLRSSDGRRRRRSAADVLCRRCCRPSARAEPARSALPRARHAGTAGLSGRRQPAGDGGALDEGRTPAAGRLSSTPGEQRQRQLSAAKFQRLFQPDVVEFSLHVVTETCPNADTRRQRPS